jgi:hypothetical protein
VHNAVKSWSHVGSYEGLGGLIDEIRRASRAIELGDDRTGKRLDQRSTRASTNFGVHWNGEAQRGSAQSNNQMTLDRLVSTIGSRKSSAQFLKVMRRER